MLQAMGKPDAAEKKALQKEQYDVACSCFEEIRRILEAIRVRYTNKFEESKTQQQEDSMRSIVVVVNFAWPVTY
jgi:hypothetical protein